MPKLPALAAILLTLTATLVLARDPQPSPKPAATEAGISVFFSPGGGCADAIVAQLQAARKSIDVQAHPLISTPIAAALKQAHDRGVNVRTVLDKDAAGAKHSAATYLTNAGIPTWLDGEHAIAHNKVIIIDGATVITGSFNFTKTAEERNARERGGNHGQAQDRRGVCKELRGAPQASRGVQGRGQQGGGRCEGLRPSTPKCGR
jgi:phosphatidylserine/phosphatidylglycerophosphate/cardiolipin synthase-like enzyme